MRKVKNVISNALDSVRRNFRGAVSTPEVNDGLPVAGMPGAVHPPTIQEMMKQFIRTEISRQAEQDGEETFEEADDFDLDDDEEDVLPMTHHEVIGMSDDELAGHAQHYGLDFTPPPATSQPIAGLRAPDEGSPGETPSA